MSATPIRERDVLAGFDQAIERWIEVVRAEAETIDPEQLDRMLTTTKRLAKRLDDSLPPSLDPSAVAELRGILLGGYRTLDEAEQAEAKDLDLLDDLLVRAESIRHIIRDALDEELPVDAASGAEVVRFLVEQLPGVTREEIARLADVSGRTVQRRLAGEGSPSRRLVLVAKLVNVLRHGWTPEGVVAWFDRPKSDLGNNRPIDVLDDPQFEVELIATARRGRAGHGS